MGNKKFYVLMIAGFLLTGCLGAGQGNLGRVQIYKVPVVEAEWIRNGEPIEFEKEMWYPADGVENLLDPDVVQVQEYRGVEVFIEKIDVRPYDRLYTKFGSNQFRYFEKK